jgi:hypothetical protein
VQIWREKQQANPTNIFAKSFNRNSNTNSIEIVMSTHRDEWQCGQYEHQTGGQSRRLGTAKAYSNRQRRKQCQKVSELKRLGERKSIRQSRNILVTASVNLLNDSQATDVTL